MEYNVLYSWLFRQYLTSHACIDVLLLTVLYFDLFFYQGIFGSWQAI